MISSADVAQTNHWLSHFRAIHEESIPTVVHGHTVDGNGSPQWSPKMRAYMSAGDPLKAWQHDSEPRRLARAMKRVRERSLREGDVLQRAVAYGQSVEEITVWLNDRAIRGGHPERYTVASTVVILFAGIHKLQEWFLGPCPDGSATH